LKNTVESVLGNYLYELVQSVLVAAAAAVAVDGAIQVDEGEPKTDENNTTTDVVAEKETATEQQS
jgi:hypothetical protein